MNRKAKRSEYRRLLDNLRALARSEEKDWDELEWSRAVRRATAEMPENLRPAARPWPGWAWAYATVIIILMGAAAAATRSFFHEAWPTLAARAEPGRAGGSAQEGVAKNLSAQNRLAVTFVSEESGLQVNWYFDKEFDWEEEP